MDTNLTARERELPAILTAGFRPFFMLAGLFAALAIAVWMPAFRGDITVQTAFAPRDWHVHEMLYGYLAAVITGFLFTAIPNWTGRLPLRGAPLLTLVILWLCGRAAVACSAKIGAAAALAVDCSFLLLVALAAAREIAAGRNWRNLPIVGLVLLLFVGNVSFHLESITWGAADVGLRLGQAVVIMLISLIGGRIVPSFTRNWLARENPGRLPVPFNGFDKLVMIASGAALVVWVALPQAVGTGALLLAAGLLQIARFVRWAGDRTAGERLVLILHLGYLFVPVGFLLTGLAALGIVTPSAGAHAWMVGAAGVMTLAVMTRASLGHTGRALHATRPIQMVYAAALTAAAARIAAALVNCWSEPLLWLAAIAWIAAFGGFAAVFAPILLTTRQRRRAPSPMPSAPQSQRG